MATVENDQIWLYCHFCHFCKIIKEPETSFESPELSQKKHVRNACDDATTSEICGFHINTKT